MREAGFYFAKAQTSVGWEVGYYDPEKNRWLFCGTYKEYIESKVDVGPKIKFPS